MNLNIGTKAVVLRGTYAIKGNTFTLVDGKDGEVATYDRV